MYIYICMCIYICVCLCIYIYIYMNWLIFPVGDGHYLQSKLPPGTMNACIQLSFEMEMSHHHCEISAIVMQDCAMSAFCLIQRACRLKGGKVTLGGCFTSPNPTRHLEDHPSQ